MIVVRKRGAPLIPVEVADEVELFARQWGRHARIEWNMHLDAPVIHFSVSPNSPLWKKWQEGDLDQEPTESVPLIEYDPNAGKYTPLDLAGYGASGIRELLERANVWSGRGEHDNLVDAIMARIERNRENREAGRRRAREAGEEAGWLGRRKALGLPQSQVLIDLKSPHTAPMEGNSNGPDNGKEEEDPW